MSELKCCPFCGGEAYTDKIGKPLFTIRCTNINCYCEISKNSLEDVINAWNTRKPMSNIVEKLEERRIEYELSSIKAPDEISTVYRKGVMRGYEYSRDLVKQEINNGLE